MQPAEIRDSSALLGTALGEVAVLVRDVHKAVSGRIFGLLGEPAAPVRMAHDAISAIVHTSTGLGVKGIPTALGAAGAVLGNPAAEPISETPKAHFALNVLNGFWGDRIAEQRAALASVLSLRTEDGQLRKLAANLAHDVGQDATGRVIVFVHGLCESDRFWTFKSRTHYERDGVTYGRLLHEDQGWTPLYASYNTGLHVSANGRLLAGYLDELLSAWPVPITEVALVGHSMGGLVVRSAAHQAAERGQAWTSKLRHVVGLGAPHLGAPLERFVNKGTHAMSRLPETRPFAEWLNRRSVGIKDLRHGALLEADWSGFDPDDGTDNCGEATLVPGVTYSMASATLSRRPDGLFAHDLLVQHVSAHGTGHPTRATRRIAFEPDRLAHIGRRTHFDLLSDPQIYAALRGWLAA
jgi:pimeloyl-ACP methyl ester carboxylesterase